MQTKYMEVVSNLKMFDQICAPENSNKKKTVSVWFEKLNLPEKHFCDEFKINFDKGSFVSIQNLSSFYVINFNYKLFFVVEFF